MVYEGIALFFAAVAGVWIAFGRRPAAALAGAGVAAVATVYAGMAAIALIGPRMPFSSGTTVNIWIGATLLAMVVGARLAWRRAA